MATGAFSGRQGKTWVRLELAILFHAEWLLESLQSLFQLAAPNLALEPTAYSLRSQR